MWELKDAATLNLSLNFRPLKAWPQALPVISFNQFVVAGFDRLQGPAFVRRDASGTGLAELLGSCYPRLALAEGARLWARLKQADLDDSIVWPLIGLKSSSDHERLLKILLSLSPEIQDWIDVRQVGPRELAILLCFRTHESITPTLETITQRGFSRNIGAQILELSGELLLMDQTPPSAPPQDQDPDGRLWLGQLEKSRRPLSSAKDSTQSEQVQAMPWPQQLRSQWKRNGDQSRLEVSLSVGSLQEWNKRLEELSKMTPHLGQADLWKS